MLTRLAPFLFWLCALAIVVAQVQILRSTRRAAAAAPESMRGRSVTEWAFAIAPMLALAALLWFSWLAVRS